MTWQPGADLDGRYRLEEKIGEGGMGEVWRGKHLALESDVAIKFLGTQLAGNQETQERFRVEAKVTAGLRSRHAVQVFDFGVTENKEPYIVMELLRGEPLSRRIERLGRLEPRKTVDLLRDAAKALSRAHGLGIVHRDFKPDNVFLVKNEEGHDEVKVVDFGIAKLIGSLNDVRPAQIDLSTLTGKSHLTRTGGMVGTPHYMGPEQVRMDADIGPAADIWALGIVAYECLTGRCPFDGDNVLELFTNIQMYKFTPATVAMPTLPPAIDDWFKKVCAPVSANRFADALSAVDALEVALGLDSNDHRPSQRSLAESTDFARGDLAGYRAVTNPAASDPDFKKNTMQGASLPISKGPGRSAWVVATLCGLAIAGFALFRAARPPAPTGSHGPVGPTIVTVSPPPTSTIPLPDSLASSIAAAASASASASSSPTASATATSASSGSTASTGAAVTAANDTTHRPGGKKPKGDPGTSTDTPPTATTATTAPPPKPTATSVLALPPTGI